MHVVFVDTTLTTPPTGGAQTFLVILCRGLVERGWKVSVVTEPGPERSIVEALLGVGAETVEHLWHYCHLPEERAERLADWVNQHSPALYVVSISPDVGWLALPLLDSNIAAPRRVAVNRSASDILAGLTSSKSGSWISFL